MRTVSTVFTPSELNRISLLRRKLVDRCEECGGEGYIPAPQEGTVVRCICLCIWEYVLQLIKSGVSQEYWRLTLEKLRIPDDVKERVSAYVQDLSEAILTQDGFLFTGPNGTGKTALMAEIVKEAVLQKHSAVMFNLAEYIEAAWGDRQDLHFTQKVDAADFLLIDEVDKQYVKPGSEWVPTTFADLLKRWWNKGKAISLATNWTFEDLEQRLGKSVASAIVRHVEVLEIDGDDMSAEVSRLRREQAGGRVGLRESEDVVRAALRYEAITMPVEEVTSRG